MDPVMYHSESRKAYIDITTMAEPHVLNAIAKLRRRLLEQPDRPEAEIAEDRRVLNALVALADERAWGTPAAPPPGAVANPGHGGF